MAKGLSCRFQLSNGKFKLTEGSDKTKDDIWFYCTFDKFRPYLSDYGANFLSLTQKPIPTIIENKTFIFANLTKGIAKYVPRTIIRNLDMGYLPEDRTQITLVVEYSSRLDDGSIIDDVVFV